MSTDATGHRYQPHWSLPTAQHVSAPFVGLLERLLEEIQNFYQDRLVTLAVFGSVGRATATHESDVDFLVVVTDLPVGRVKRVNEFAQIESRLRVDIEDLKQVGIYTCLSPVIKTPDEVLAGSLLFLDMIFDAVILYDKDDFFQAFLQGFNEQLDRLGAKRIVQGDRWYWDLKPDYKVGEVFEL